MLEIKVRSDLLKRALRKPGRRLEFHRLAFQVTDPLADIGQPSVQVLDRRLTLENRGVVGQLPDPLLQVVDAHLLVIGGSRLAGRALEGAYSPFRCIFGQVRCVGEMRELLADLRRGAPAAG